MLNRNKNNCVWSIQTLAGVLSGLLLLGVTFYLTGTDSGSKPIENVLLISIDTLRADRLGCYGYGANTSPTLDQLAARGLQFTQAISQSPWTTPAHMSLMTSLVPSSHTVNHDFRQYRKHQRGRGNFRILPEDVPTLAGLLKARGFHTLALTGGGTIGGQLGFARGFDQYVESARKLRPETWSQLVEWLANPNLRPFFLFFHTFEVHAPYLHIEDAKEVLRPNEFDRLQAFIDDNPNMSPRDLKRYLQEQNLFRKEVTSLLYDGGIRFTDRFLARLFNELRRRDLWATTLIVVTSDHGEEFEEHRRGKFYNVHCDTTYEELVRVPLIWHVPNHSWEGRVIPDQVRLIDVAPTILELLELPVPSSMQGKSLVELMKRGRWAQSLPAFTEANCAGPEWKSLRQNGTKYVAIITGDQSERTGMQRQPAKENLFDLHRDPQERRNLARARKDVLERLRSQMRAHYSRDALPVTDSEGELGVSEALTEQLEALGYLD